jgi:hypothetical protein
MSDSTSIPPGGGTSGTPSPGFDPDDYSKQNSDMNNAIMSNLGPGPMAEGSPDQPAPAPAGGTAAPAPQPSAS